MPAYLVQIEGTDEQIILIFLAKHFRLVANDAAGSSRTHVCHDRHEVAGFFMGVGNLIDFPIYATVDGMNEPIAMARLMRDKKGAAQDSLTFRRERHAHWIVHATGQDRLQSVVIRARAKNVRRPALTIHMLSM